MAAKQGPDGILWTDHTWNPVRGCTRVSEGCRNCYAEVMAARFSDTGQWGHGFAEMKGGDHRWTGKVALIEDQLALPLRWKKPRRIFVNSTSDLFHESLPDEAIDRIFAVMALSPQHTFQVLTKRPERMRKWLDDRWRISRVARLAMDLLPDDRTLENAIIIAPQQEVSFGFARWPLPNVWLGTSVEDQATADERIPHLLKTPAAIRFVSYEPALGPVDFETWLRIAWQCSTCRRYYSGRHRPSCPDCGSLGGWTGSHQFNPPRGQVGSGLDWIICGGESGPGARPMHPDWARSVRDQCADAGVPFFFKQWGIWHPCEMKDGVCYAMPGHAPFNSWRAPMFDPTTEEGWNWRMLGKKAAGRLLDGVEHNGFPAPELQRAAA